MDLQLNATRRSVNGCLSGVRFGSGAIQISEAVENEVFTLDSFLQRVV